MRIPAAEVAETHDALCFFFSGREEERGVDDS